MSHQEASALTPELSQHFRRLPEACYREAEATPSPAPYRIAANASLAKELGVSSEWLLSEDALSRFAGCTPFARSPVAFAYAGHQFGQFNPQLGDGRALLLGETSRSDGQLIELQLKGSGRTDFSRGGDGKSPIGPVIREYILCEAMHALGVPTTRALYALGTGETVYRDQPLPGAILCRSGQSFIRVGSMQFFAARGDTKSLSALVDATLQRCFPAQTDAPSDDTKSSQSPALTLLNQVIDAQASLIAKWQGLGFIHGVMNTDNMLLSGETIDYGPCAFMEAYDPATVFSSIDHQGRYAYGNQPGIAHWNLAQLAQALIPLIDEDADTALSLAQDSVNRFPQRFLDAYHSLFAAKLGLSQCRDEADEKLISDFLECLKAEAMDFTNGFRELAGALEPDSANDKSTQFDTWLQRWRQRCSEETDGSEAIRTRILSNNPAVIPRNHLVQAAIDEAEQDGQFSFFHELLTVCTRPYSSDDLDQKWTRPASPQQQVRQTFCGT